MSIQIDGGSCQAFVDNDKKNTYLNIHIESLDVHASTNLTKGQPAVFIHYGSLVKLIIFEDDAAASEWQQQVVEDQGTYHSATFFWIKGE